MAKIGKITAMIFFSFLEQRLEPLCHFDPNHVARVDKQGCNSPVNTSTSTVPGEGETL